MWEPGTAIAGSCRGRAGCRPVCSGNRSRCGGSCRMPGNANTRFCTPNNRQNAPDEPPQWEENALARHLNFQQIPQTSETHRPQARTQKGLNQPQKRGLPPKSRALKKPPTSGITYKASGWIHVGATQGRGRYDTRKEFGKPIKAIWLCPLRKDWKRTLNQ